MLGRRPWSAGIAAAALGLVTLLALAAMTFLAARADAYIYWADSQNRRIGRAANDGTAVDGSFVPTTGQIPFAVAVDAAHVYWANQDSNSIGRANIDGSAATNSFITGVTEPSGLAVNGSSIFWSSLAGSVGRANLNGTGKDNSFISGLTLPCGVALDAGHVYWGEIDTGSPAYIGRASLDGSNKQPNFVTIPGTASPCGVAVNAANIYWTEPGIFGGGTRIGRANINGGGTADPSFIGDASTPCGIAVFGQQLFWSNSGTDTIARANTDATGVNEGFIATGANEPCGVAVDALAPPPKQPELPASPGGTAGDKQAPQTTIGSGPGSKLADGKARFAFKSSEAGSTFQCKLDGRKAARCKSPRVFKRLKPGRHTFRVWATDAAGNKDPTPARRSFRVPPVD
jgi:hypothetical protein